MSRCQHCSRLTHSEDLYVEYLREDEDKIRELEDHKDWVHPFAYLPTNPNEVGVLKCNDICIHFVCKENNKNDQK